MTCALALLASGDSLLVERAHKDSYWGDGGDGSGQNRLGQLLMQVRTELGAQAGSSANHLILQWLFDSGQIDLSRAAMLTSIPPAHIRPVKWDRVEGMLLGLAIGDALGNTSESTLPAERLGRLWSDS